MKVFYVVIKISLVFVCKGSRTITQHWFRSWFGAEYATSHYLNQCCLDSLTHIWRNGVRSFKACTWSPATPFTITWIKLFPAWISNYIQYKVLYEIIYPFTNLTVAPLGFGNGCIISSILNWTCDFLSMLELKLIHVSKFCPGVCSCYKSRVSIPGGTELLIWRGL